MVVHQTNRLTNSNKLQMTARQLPLKLFLRLRNLLLDIARRMRNRLVGMRIHLWHNTLSSSCHLEIVKVYANNTLDMRYTHTNAPSPAGLEGI